MDFGFFWLWISLPNPIQNCNFFGFRTSGSIFRCFFFTNSMTLNPEQTKTKVFSYFGNHFSPFVPVLSPEEI
jgi:hypothetical protein